MQYTFDTDEPIELILEAGAGIAIIDAVDTSQTQVRISGKDADRFTVEHRGRQVKISSLRRWFVGLDLGSHAVQIEVTLPSGSDVNAKVGSTNLSTAGVLELTTIKSGSGDVSIDTTSRLDLYSGSGEVRAQWVTAGGNIRTGSSSVTIDRTAGALSLVSGSGDLSVRQLAGELTTKTGSGDLTVHELSGSAHLASASGDIRVNRMADGYLRARTASGDVSLTAAADTPVWTDVSTAGGNMTSRLEHLGEPAEGQNFVEWYVRSASGDVDLQHAAATPHAEREPAG